MSTTTLIIIILVILLLGGFGFRRWRRHLDEIYVKLGSEIIYLWRAVHHEGGAITNAIENLTIGPKAA